MKVKIRILLSRWSCFVETTESVIWQNFREINVIPNMRKKLLILGRLGLALLALIYFYHPIPTNNDPLPFHDGHPDHHVDSANTRQMHWDF